MELEVIFYIQVFMTAALFNNVRDVMTRFFSGAIPYAAEARTSINRVEVTIQVYAYYSGDIFTTHYLF